LIATFREPKQPGKLKLDAKSPAMPFKVKFMDTRFAERAIEPRYLITEAASVVGRPQGMIRRWSVGHRRIYKGERRMDPPLIRIDGDAGRGEVPLSFLNLLELRFLASYREDATLPAIRRALAFAAEEMGVRRPLLELDFAVHGRELFLRFAEDEPYFVNASRDGQIMIWPEDAGTFLDSVEYDEEERKAYKWWPLGKERPVVLDTRLNAGQPSTSRTGIRTEAIASRRVSGWDSAAIESDLGVLPEEIDAALELQAAA
jgi:uncharacterized protein (DUF433 family)